MRSTLHISLAATALALAVGSDTSLAGPPPNKGKTVTLTLASGEPQGRPLSRIADAFAARAKALSKGTLVVKVVYNAGRTTQELPTGKLEANVIRLVRSGDAQLAVIPTRAFQAEGTTSFAALQAPFLVTSDAGMARVTTGKIATELQSGLGRLGLKGLGLAPDGLRRAFGFKKPLRGPADYKGVRIRAIPSKPTWLLFKALGAKPVDLNGNAFDDAVVNGSVQAVDSTLEIAAEGGLPARASVAGNVAFYPKIDAVVGNPAALRRLSRDQRAALRRAAAAARSWSLRSLTETRSRNTFCKHGGTVVKATKSEVAQLRARVAPVLSEMGKDPLTRRLMADIQALGLPTSAVAPCSPGADKSPPVELIPAGVYRWEAIEAEIRAAGMTAGEAYENAGTWTLTTTDDGYQTIHVDAVHPEWTTACNKRKMYVRNGLVVLELRGPKCGGYLAVAWEPVPDGIRITRTSVAVDRWMIGRVWKKIG